MGNDHASLILQPSGFSRTLGCPGWGRLSAPLPEKPSSVHAMDGSIAHCLAERCLQRGDDAETYIDHWGYYSTYGANILADLSALKKSTVIHHRKQIDAEMAEAVQIYLDEIRRKRKAIPGKYFIEERLSMEWLVPGMYGTADHLIIEPFGRIYVDDYKHGAGVVVEVGENVGDNVQLSLYGLGALADNNPYLAEEVTVCITQPRAPHYLGPVRSITFRVRELFTWGHDVVVPVVKKAQQPDAPLNAGDWCRWCPARDPIDNVWQGCPEIRKEALKAVDVMFDDEIVPVESTFEVPEPKGLSGEQLGKILNFIDVFEPWLKEVRNEGLKRLENGSVDSPVGFKLVQGKPDNRKWKDETEVEKSIRSYLTSNDIYEAPKLKSPAQMEKTLKAAAKLKPKEAKAVIGGLIERAEGKKIMVPETDPRPTAKNNLEELFG